MTDPDQRAVRESLPGAGTFPVPPPPSSVPTWYAGLLEAVAQRVAAGRGRAIAAVNQELTATYWAIGSDILDRQSEQGWGAKVIDRLSADLQQRFPGARGFSPRNLKYMRAFAQAWPEEVIVQAPLAQLPWYHHIALLTTLDQPDARLWYAAAAVENGWSRNVLAHHISARLIDRSGKAITNFAATIAPADSDLAQQATRDPYLFDFIGNADLRHERNLEQALIDHVSSFLLELGQGFAYVGRQVRLEIDDQDFYCDLLFYHLRLRAYIVIELKVTDFEPGYLGHWACTWRPSTTSWPTRTTNQQSVCCCANRRTTSSPSTRCAGTTPHRRRRMDHRHHHLATRRTHQRPTQHRTTRSRTRRRRHHRSAGLTVPVCPAVEASRPGW